VCGISQVTKELRIEKKECSQQSFGMMEESTQFHLLLILLSRLEDFMVIKTVSSQQICLPISISNTVLVIAWAHDIVKGTEKLQDTVIPKNGTSWRDDDEDEDSEDENSEDEDSEGEDSEELLDKDTSYRAKLDRIIALEAKVTTTVCILCQRRHTDLKFIC
jgi:hypothetical protein